MDQLDLKLYPKIELRFFKSFKSHGTVTSYKGWRSAKRDFKLNLALGPEKLNHAYNYNDQGCFHGVFVLILYSTKSTRKDWIQSDVEFQKTIVPLHWQPSPTPPVSKYLEKLKSRTVKKRWSEHILVLITFTHPPHS